MILVPHLVKPASKPAVKSEVKMCWTSNERVFVGLAAGRPQLCRQAGSELVMGWEQVGCTGWLCRACSHRVPLGGAVTHWKPKTFKLWIHCC